MSLSGWGLQNMISPKLETRDKWLRPTQSRMSQGLSLCNQAPKPRDGLTTYSSYPLVSPHQKWQRIVNQVKFVNDWNWVNFKPLFFSLTESILFTTKMLKWTPQFYSFIPTYIISISGSLF